jgi:transcription antitermination factor NusG
VPSGIIDELRQRSDTDGYVVLARQADLGRGDRIRIDRGPFTDYEAVFEAQRDNERVVALLSLLGRKVLVSLPIGAVAPA